jgi:hypothetical protein
MYPFVQSFKDGTTNSMQTGQLISPNRVSLRALDKSSISSVFKMLLEEQKSKAAE